MIKQLKNIKKKNNIISSKKSKNKIYKLYIKKTLNNTFITLSDIKGNTKIFYSTGKLGFKGSKRSSKYASESVFIHVIKYCVSLKIRKIILYFNGFKKFLKFSTKILKSNRIKLLAIYNNISITYNGCRAPKVRRI